MIAFDTGFSHLLKKYREKRGLTLRELSQATTIGAITLSRYEQGVRDPTFPAALVLAHVLQISWDSLCAKIPTAIDNLYPNGYKGAARLGVRRKAKEK